MDELAAAGRVFDARGWVLGTVGNLSARRPDGTIVITASGRHKGELTANDFVRVDADGNVVERVDPGARPSNETPIHCALYRLLPDAQFCFHVHSVESNLVAERCASDGLDLPPLEMVKILGIWEEEPKARLPLFENHFDPARIASDITERFHGDPPAIPALLVRRHGITVWGATAASTRASVEALEFVLRYLALGGE